MSQCGCSTGCSCACSCKLSKKLHPPVGVFLKKSWNVLDNQYARVRVPSMVYPYHILPLYGWFFKLSCCTLRLMFNDLRGNLRHETVNSSKLNLAMASNFKQPGFRLKHWRGVQRVETVCPRSTQIGFKLSSFLQDAQQPACLEIC